MSRTIQSILWNRLAAAIPGSATLLPGLLVIAAFIFPAYTFGLWTRDVGSHIDGAINATLNLEPSSTAFIAVKIILRLIVGTAFCYVVSSGLRASSDDDLRSHESDTLKGVFDEIHPREIESDGQVFLALRQLLHRASELDGSQGQRLGTHLRGIAEDAANVEMYPNRLLLRLALERHFESTAHPRPYSFLEKFIGWSERLSSLRRALLFKSTAIAMIIACGAACTIGLLSHAYPNSKTTWPYPYPILIHGALLVLFLVFARMRTMPELEWLNGNLREAMKSGHDRVCSWNRRAYSAVRLACLRALQDATPPESRVVETLESIEGALGECTPVALLRRRMELAKVTGEPPITIRVDDLTGTLTFQDAKAAVDRWDRAMASTAEIREVLARYATIWDDLVALSRDVHSSRPGLISSELIVRSAAGIDQVSADPASDQWKPASIVWKHKRWRNLLTKGTEMIWASFWVADPNSKTVLYFRRNVHLPSELGRATLGVVVDDEARVTINGKTVDHVFKGEEGKGGIDVSTFLQRGMNVIQFEVMNYDATTAVGRPKASKTENPAGLAYELRVYLNG